MPTTTTSAPVATATLPTVRLLSGERFFVRRIPIATDSPVTPQIELALETLSPFPIEQMFHGHVLDRMRRHAFIYAAYRRNFSAAEQSDWAHAENVIPEFLMHVFALRGPRATAATLHETDTALTAIVWDDLSELPSLLLQRPISADNREQTKTELLAELTRRTQVSTDEHSILEGPITVNRTEKTGLRLACDNQTTPPLNATLLSAADVRDKEVLATRQREQRRATWWGNAFVGTITLLILCLIVELGTLGTSGLLATRQDRLAQRAPEIQKIESAQNLANRMESLAAQQLRPFEMLAVINTPRPSSVEFLRVSTRGPLQIDIDAETANAGDLRTYETALKQLPAIASVDIRDPRSRSGRTTFSLEVSFQPNWAQSGGGL